MDDCEALVRRGAMEAVVGGDLDVIDELFAEDLLDHDADPDAPPGRAGLKQGVAAVVAGLSDREMASYEVFSADGRVVEIWELRGRHTGDYLGVAPTNRGIAIRGVEIWRCGGGRIVERWAGIDRLAILEQLRAAPNRGTPGAGHDDVAT